MSKYVPGYGNPHAKLMIIGDYPCFQDEQEGRPFSGNAGALLWNILDELGISIQDVWITNLYKYYPPAGHIRNLGQVCDLEEEKKKLWIEIKDIKPNCILTLGDLAFNEVRGHSGLLKWRGSILTTRQGDIKLVGSISPANLTRSREYTGYKVYAYIWKSILKMDIERAVVQSRTPEQNLLKPYITICHNSMQLSRFLDQNKDKEKVSLDIESYNCIPIMMGIAFTPHEALVVPFFRSLGGLKISEMSNSDQIYVWVLLNKLLKEKKIIGQNFKYDQEKLEMLGFSFNPDRPIWSDTLIKAHTINPELPSKRMEMLQSIWTELPYHKDEGKEFIKGKQDITKLFHYCGLDVISTLVTDINMEDDLVEMSEAYGVDLVGYYYNYKMLLHSVYMDMERIGFRRDEEATAYLKFKYQDQHSQIQDLLNELVPDFEVSGKKCHPGHRVNVAAPKQMKALLYSYLKCPERKRLGKIKADEDVIIALLNNNITDDRRITILQSILEDRKTRKTLGTYVLAKSDYDGRIRGSYRLTGTETGRTSTTILKPPLRPTKSGHAFQTLTKHGEIGKDIRTMYIADEGFCFVQVDLSQAEPRIVALLSNDVKLSQAFDSGKVDIHRRTAALVLGMMDELDLSENYIEIADSIPKESPERFLGKTSRNGGNYDMGKKELANSIAVQARKSKMNITISEWKANKMLESFHRESPNIRAVFHKEIQEAINNTRVLVNPYGKVRMFQDRLHAKPIYAEGYAELPQGTVSDHVKHAILWIKKEMPDFKRMLMGEAHDALFFRFPLGEEKDRALLVKRKLETPIDFSSCTLKRGLVKIPVDVEVSYTNYRDLEKMKF